MAANRCQEIWAWNSCDLASVVLVALDAYYWGKQHVEPLLQAFLTDQEMPEKALVSGPWE